jgi:hypothetical protein
MGKINALLTERLKKTQASSKMAAMARQSANGNLTSFSGVFSIADLSEMEKTGIEAILREYAHDSQIIAKDLNTLISITSEVKAINNQAALLHGERIKKAQNILTRYRDGAFTAWLISAYGNRQTPYNLMQYYEFCEAMPKTLRVQIELMPRQAIYTLASREGPLDKKKRIVEDYKGQTKAELLNLIRKMFPLDGQDKRLKSSGESIVKILKQLFRKLKSGPAAFSHSQKEAASTLLSEIQHMIERSKGS